MPWESWPVTDTITGVATANPAAEPLTCYKYPALGPNQGAPLVLLHGWGCDSHSWQPLVPALQALGDVIAVDLPGFGASAPVLEFDLETVLQRLEDCLPPRCILMGWSLGGMLALAMAERCPDRVQCVITLASNLTFV